MLVSARASRRLLRPAMLKISKPSGLQALPPLVAAASSDDLARLQVSHPSVLARWAFLTLACSALLLAEALT